MAIRFACEVRTRSWCCQATRITDRPKRRSGLPFVLTALKTVVVRSSIGAGAKTRLLYCDEWHSPELSIYR
ncbi:hypothetical protein SAMN05216599_101751 [Pseudomonas cichorii]|nr:hypothetical protein SAMN05216599_101751 [Pseudomonas cichorii]